MPIDLMHEAWRSRLLGIVVLMIILQDLAAVILMPVPFCIASLSGFDESVKPNTQEEHDALLRLFSIANTNGFIMPILALLGASRWQSAWFLVPGLVSAFVQVIVLSLLDAKYCFALAPYGDSTSPVNIDMPSWAGILSFLPQSARFVAFVRLFDWALTLVALFILLFLCVKHLVLPSLRAQQLTTLANENARSGVGYAQLSAAESSAVALSKAAGNVSNSGDGAGDGDGYGFADKGIYVHHSIPTYMRLRELERVHDTDASPCWAVYWLAFRMQLVPLRHALAVFLSAFCLAMLQLLMESLTRGLLSDIDTSIEPGTMSDLARSLLNSLVNSQTAVTCFGAFSLFVSLVIVSGDVVRLLEAYRGVWDPTFSATEVSPFADGGSLDPSTNANAAAVRLADVSVTPIFLKDMSVLFSRAAALLGGGSGSTSREELPRALDLARFEFTDASGYIIMLTTTLLSVCACLMVAFVVINFVFTYPPLRSWMLSWVFTTIIFAILRILIIRWARCCCASGNQVMKPRLFLCFDSALSFVASAIFSVSIGITRVAILLILSLLSASQISFTPLPSSLNMLDTGFAMYGAMLKVYMAWAIDPECAPKPGMVDVI